MTPLEPGEALGQIGCYGQARFGGWFRRAGDGAPLLLTVAHVLDPRPLRQGREHGCREPVVDLAGHDIQLCRAGSGEGVARVLASGRYDKYHGVISLDAAIAEPLSPGLVPARPSTPVAAVGWVEAALGRPVHIAPRGRPARHGTIVAVDWPSGHFGWRSDILIESLDGEPFSSAGDSGALVISTETGAALGLLVGEALDLAIAGRRRAALACAHPLPAVMDLFGLTTA